MLLLPLGDLLAVTREFLNPDVSRYELKAKEAVATIKGFKPYEPGFQHIDVKYLPQMPDETKRRYLFVAIDRATR
jgi:hypothetical protein